MKVTIAISYSDNIWSKNLLLERRWHLLRVEALLIAIHPELYATIDRR